MALFESKKQKAEIEALKNKAKVEKMNQGKVKVENAKLKGELEVKTEELQAQKNLVSLLKEYKDLHDKNIKAKLKLDEREKVLDAKEEAQETFKKEIKKLEVEVTSAEDRGYKKGYADGVSDGVRKGLDSTKDDRKMMAQIAAIAAASPPPEATSMIAREVANGIAKDIAGELPATTRNKNK